MPTDRDDAAGACGAATLVTLLDRIGLRGPDGESHESQLPGPQAKLAFAHLVLNRRAPVSFERLADAVWEDDPPATWRPALRSIVARVRSFVTSAASKAAIEAGPNGYQLQLPDPVEVDLEVAQDAARRAEEALDAERLEEAVAQAALVVRIARGSFLANEQHDWVTQIHYNLRGLRLRALHVLGETHLRRDAPDRAARAAREAIEVAPLHEASHRLAMRALAAAGETGEAAQAFDRCRRALGEELGVTPSKQTTELLTAILRDT